MSEDTRLGAPAPAWLYDDETGRTRWWDGARFTDLSKPLDPVVRTAPTYRAAPEAAYGAYAPPVAKSAPLRASHVLLLVAGLGILGTFAAVSLGVIPLG